MLPEFEKATGYRVEVYSGSDVYRQAELGKADILISHYGKAPVEQFVLTGKGAWPRPVFSNQIVLMGPTSDPAKIRGMTNPFDAMKKIAASGSKYVAASDPGGRYLSELLLAGAGNPERGTWYIEARESKERAMKFAEERKAYTIWGSFPFERFRRKHDTGLEVMVWDTPIFHRVMATIVVSPRNSAARSTSKVPRLLRPTCFHPAPRRRSPRSARKGSAGRPGGRPGATIIPRSFSA